MSRLNTTSRWRRPLWLAASTLTLIHAGCSSESESPSDDDCDDCGTSTGGDVSEPSDGTGATGAGATSSGTGGNSSSGGNGSGGEASGGSSMGGAPMGGASSGGASSGGAAMGGMGGEPVELNEDAVTGQCDPELDALVPYGTMTANSGWKAIEPSPVGDKMYVTLLGEKTISDSDQDNLFKVGELTASGISELAAEVLWATPRDAMSSYVSRDGGRRIISFIHSLGDSYVSTVSSEGAFTGVSVRDWNVNPYDLALPYGDSVNVIVMARGDGFFRVMSTHANGTMNKTLAHGTLPASIVDADIVGDEIYIDYADRTEVRALNTANGDIGDTIAETLSVNGPASATSRENHFVTFGEADSEVTGLLTVSADDKGTLTYGTLGGDTIQLESLAPGSDPWTESFVYETEGKTIVFLYESESGRAAAYELAELCADQ